MTIQSFVHKPHCRRVRLVKLPHRFVTVFITHKRNFLRDKLPGQSCDVTVKCNYSTVHIFYGELIDQQFSKA